MDGYLAPLKEICDLAEQYGAVVMVDDSHAVGLLGQGGKGTPELAGVGSRVDIYTGTFGKALGGAAGGYVSGRKEIVEILRQKARPYLFSNSLAPAIVAGSLAAIRIAADPIEGVKLRQKLHANAQRFRSGMTAEGFSLLEGEHPIIPVMLGDALLAAKLAKSMFKNGVYVTAFSFPVVPREKARIRVQLSASHSEQDIDSCVAAFVKARDEVII
jgi:glycine C-acetyltransferase